MKEDVMNAAAYLNLSETHLIAYHRIRPTRDVIERPGVMFLGGFKSDMTGNKALFLQDWAVERDLAFVRFDYRGHGESSGSFEECCISDWLDDASAVLERLTSGPQIIVGSSMGGWIALLLAKRFPERVAGLVGIAAAPDFTADSMPARLSEEQRAAMARDGHVALPSQYSDEPYVITQKLLEDGQQHLVLRLPLTLPFPVRLLHGTADPDVDVAVSMRLLEHLESPDARLHMVKDADHRFSEPRELRLLGDTLDELLSRR